MNKIVHFIKENTTFVSLLFICIMLLVVFILIATVSGAWPGPGASGQILSALAGAVVAAMITLFLLLGQTSSEEKKERNSKVFEEKLKIYQDFLESLNDVLEDGVVTPEEALKLKFKISMIALHTNSQRINTISESVLNIFQTLNSRQGKIEKDQVQLNVNLDELFKIVNQFRLEIYDENYGIDDKELKRTLENFHIIDEAYNSNAYNPDIKPEIEEKVENAIIRPVNEYCGELGDSYANLGWELKNDESHPIILDKEGIRIKIESDDNWYISIVTDDPPYTYKFRRELYLQLRRVFGGNFNTNAPWGWYTYLPDEYKGMSQEDFMDGMISNDDFKEYIKGILQKFVEYMDKIPILGSVIYKQLKKTSLKWQSWPYLDEGLCLANDYGNEAGHPFIDFLVEQDGYVVELSVRNGNEYLKGFLSRIGLDDNRKNEKDRWRERFQNLDEAIAKANDLIARIERNDNNK